MRHGRGPPRVRTGGVSAAETSNGVRGVRGVQGGHVLTVAGSVKGGSPPPGVPIPPVGAGA